ncbi:hypothetical protein [Thalassobaculum litoreum]|uniref:Uncharacterized protein n=1 Tax=Thalassobaculum litoreum DSM 18839 TaxID=1123362 RepID=A0A8G2BI70_9PROT|nr:hypothetical protein [Thalassobaculum litoreum]SDF83830.1 hypothetical protein SAMN05660686_02484 [Thalassobaculum litoreum DSM 18839]
MTIVLDGVTFQDSDWVNRGHLTTITVNGQSYQRWEGMWQAGIRELNTRITGVGSTLTATSTTSETIGAGSKALTIQASKGFAAGNIITAFQTGTPTNYMTGTVDSYDSGTGALAFTVAAGDFGGSGTIAAWTVTISGKTGATGTVSAAGDGTIGAPGMSWANDPDTGFTRTATGETSYSADGSKILDFGPNGLTMNDKPVIKPAAATSSITHDSSGALTFNLANGNDFVVTVSADITDIDFTNVPSGLSLVVSVEFINGGTASVTWESTGSTAIRAAGGTAPTLTESGTDVVQFLLRPSGAPIITSVALDVQDIA